MHHPPPPSFSARVVSILTLCVAPFVLLLVWGSAAFNVRPTSGATFMELEAVELAEPATEYSPAGDANVGPGRTLVEVEFYTEPRLSDAYFLGQELAHLLAALLVVLAVVVAIGVLRRRPAGRGVALALGLIALAATFTAVAGPRARTWSMQRAIEVFDLPTSAAAAQQQGADYYVLEPYVEAYEWTAGFGLAAVTALAAAVYVLHVRRQLQRG